MVIGQNISAMPVLVPKNGNLTRKSTGQKKAGGFFSWLFRRQIYYEEQSTIFHSVFFISFNQFDLRSLAFFHACDGGDLLWLPFCQSYWCIALSLGWITELGIYCGQVQFIQMLVVKYAQTNCSHQLVFARILILHSSCRLLILVSKRYQKAHVGTGRLNDQKPIKQLHC